MTDIASFFSAPRLDLPALSAWLDSLDHPSRVAAVRSLGRREQARLFEQAQGFRPWRLDDLVPREAGTGRPVIHYGRNSLPGFSLFEKHFVRLDGQVELAGYNEGSARRFVGPGYFLARPHEAREEQEVLVDYRSLPPSRPLPAWPALRSNAVGLSLLVFHQLTDVLRGVSTHVSIGCGYKHGKPLSAWFVLVREP